MEREVTLPEMLDAREARARRQEELLEQYSGPVISFTLNIAGPVKNGPVLRRAFQEGMGWLKDSLACAGAAVLHREETDRVTGREALLAVRGEGRQIKGLCTALEEGTPLGRLFDLDVLDRERGKWDRADLGLPPRGCLVCGREGKACASRRLHTVEELQQATRAILRAHFAQADGDRLAAQGARALLYEVAATPKPGLVDRANNGSHRDMDFFTFLDSAAALLPYLRRAVSIGQETAALAPEETFARLRRAGIGAERAMFAATGGVNTHKGAIFSMGLACAGAGRLWKPEAPFAGAEAVLAECARLCREAVEADLAAIDPKTARTAGQRLYLEHGLRGVRGEAAEGFPAVARVALPALRAALAEGADLEEAGCAALTALMAGTVDTNLIARGGLEGQRWAAERARQLLKKGRPSRRTLERLDRELIARNLSPGGCADLLAVTYFLHFAGAPPDQGGGV